MPVYTTSFATESAYDTLSIGSTVYSGASGVGSASSPVLVPASSGAKANSALCCTAMQTSNSHPFLKSMLSAVLRYIFVIPFRKCHTTPRDDNALRPLLT